MNERELCPFKMLGNRGLLNCEKDRCQLYIKSEGKCAFAVLASPVCIEMKEREPECLKSANE